MTPFDPFRPTPLQIALVELREDCREAGDADGVRIAQEALCRLIEAASLPPVQPPPLLFRGRCSSCSAFNERRFASTFSEEHRCPCGVAVAWRTGPMTGSRGFEEVSVGAEPTHP